MEHRPPKLPAPAAPFRSRQAHEWCCRIREGLGSTTRNVLPRSRVTAKLARCRRPPGWRTAPRTALPGLPQWLLGVWDASAGPHRRRRHRVLQPSTSVEQLVLVDGQLPACLPVRRQLWRAPPLPCTHPATPARWPVRAHRRGRGSGTDRRGVADVAVRCPSRSFTIVGDRVQARHGFTESWQERLERIGLDRINLASLNIN